MSSGEELLDLCSQLETISTVRKWQASPFTTLLYSINLLIARSALVIGSKGGRASRKVEEGNSDNESYIVEFETHIQQIWMSLMGVWKNFVYYCR